METNSSASSSQFDKKYKLLPSTHIQDASHGTPVLSSCGSDSESESRSSNTASTGSNSKLSSSNPTESSSRATSHSKCDGISLSEESEATVLDDKSSIDCEGITRSPSQCSEFRSEDFNDICDDSSSISSAVPHKELMAHSDQGKTENTVDSDKIQDKVDSDKIQDKVDNEVKHVINVTSSDPDWIKATETEDKQESVSEQVNNEEVENAVMCLLQDQSVEEETEAAGEVINDLNAAQVITTDNMYTDDFDEGSEAELERSKACDNVKTLVCAGEDRNSVDVVLAKESKREELLEECEQSDQVSDKLTDRKKLALDRTDTDLCVILDSETEESQDSDHQNLSDEVVQGDVKTKDDSTACGVINKHSDRKDLEDYEVVLASDTESEQELEIKEQTDDKVLDSKTGELRSDQNSLDSEVSSNLEVKTRGKKESEFALGSLAPNSAQKNSLEAEENTGESSLNDAGNLVSEEKQDRQKEGVKDDDQEIYDSKMIDEKVGGFEEKVEAVEKGTNEVLKDLRQDLKKMKGNDHEHRDVTETKEVKKQTDEKVESGMKIQDGNLKENDNKNVQETETMEGIQQDKTVKDGEDRESREMQEEVGVNDGTCGEKDEENGDTVEKSGENNEEKREGEESADEEIRFGFNYDELPTESDTNDDESDGEDSEEEMCDDSPVMSLSFARRISKETTNDDSGAGMDGGEELVTLENAVMKTSNVPDVDVIAISDEAEEEDDVEVLPKKACKIIYQVCKACCICDFMTMSKSMLLTHIDNHKAGKHHCNYCDNFMTSLTDLKEHETRHKNFGTTKIKVRGVTTKPGAMFRCSKCPLVLASAIDIGKHYLLNHRNFRCEECQTFFPTELIYEQHMVDLHDGSRERLRSVLNKINHDKYKFTSYLSQKDILNIQQKDAAAQRAKTSGPQVPAVQPNTEVSDKKGILRLDTYLSNAVFKSQLYKVEIGDGENDVCLKGFSSGLSSDRQEPAHSSIRDCKQIMKRLKAKGKELNIKKTADVSPPKVTVNPVTIAPAMHYQAQSTEFQNQGIAVTSQAQNLSVENLKVVAASNMGQNITILAIQSPTQQGLSPQAVPLVTTLPPTSNYAAAQYNANPQKGPPSISRIGGYVSPYVGSPQVMRLPNCPTSSTLVLGSAVQSLGMQMASVQGSAVQSSSMQRLPLQSSGIQFTLVQGAPVQSTSVPSPVIQLASLQGPAIPITSVQSSAVQMSPVQGAGFSGIKSLPWSIGQTGQQTKILVPVSTKMVPVSTVVATASPRLVGTTGPRLVGTTAPRLAGTTAPRLVGTTAPRLVGTTAQVMQTEARKHIPQSVQTPQGFISAVPRPTVQPTPGLRFAAVPVPRVSNSSLQPITRLQVPMYTNIQAGSDSFTLSGQSSVKVNQSGYIRMPLQKPGDPVKPGEIVQKQAILDAGHLTHGPMIKDLNIGVVDPTTTTPSAPLNRVPAPNIKDLNIGVSSPKTLPPQIPPPIISDPNIGVINTSTERVTPQKRIPKHPKENAWKKKYKIKKCSVMVVDLMHRKRKGRVFRKQKSVKQHLVNPVMRSLDTVNGKERFIIPGKPQSNSEHKDTLRTHGQEEEQHGTSTHFNVPLVTDPASQYKLATALNQPPMLPTQATKITGSSLTLSPRERAYTSLSAVELGQNPGKLVDTIPAPGQSSGLIFNQGVSLTSPKVVTTPKQMPVLKRKPDMLKKTDPKVTVKGSSKHVLYRRDVLQQVLSSSINQRSSSPDGLKNVQITSVVGSPPENKLKPVEMRLKSVEMRPKPVLIMQPREKEPHQPIARSTVQQQQQQPNARPVPVFLSSYPAMVSGPGASSAQPMRAKCQPAAPSQATSTLTVMSSEAMLRQLQNANKSMEDLAKEGIKAKSMENIAKEGINSKSLAKNVDNPPNTQEKKRVRKKKVCPTDEPIEPNDDGLYSCSRCVYNTNAEHKFREHLGAHVHQRFVCKVCKKAMIKSSDLTKHWHKHKHVTSSGMLMCDSCDFLTTTRSVLEDHMKRHYYVKHPERLDSFTEEELIMYWGCHGFKYVKMEDYVPDVNALKDSYTRKPKSEPRKRLSEDGTSASSWQSLDMKPAKRRSVDGLTEQRKTADLTKASESNTIKATNFTSAGKTVREMLGLPPKSATAEEKNSSDVSNVAQSGVTKMPCTEGDAHMFKPVWDEQLLVPNLVKPVTVQSELVKSQAKQHEPQSAAAGSLRNISSISSPGSVMCPRCGIIVSASHLSIHLRDKHGVYPIQYLPNQQPKPVQHPQLVPKQQPVLIKPKSVGPMFTKSAVKKSEEIKQMYYWCDKTRRKRQYKVFFQYWQSFGENKIVCKKCGKKFMKKKNMNCAQRHSVACWDLEGVEEGARLVQKRRTGGGKANTDLEVYIERADDEVVVGRGGGEEDGEDVGGGGLIDEGETESEDSENENTDTAAEGEEEEEGHEEAIEEGVEIVGENEWEEAMKTNDKAVTGKKKGHELDSDSEDSEEEFME